jgi:hypothetical protein
VFMSVFLSIQSIGDFAPVSTPSLAFKLAFCGGMTVAPGIRRFATSRASSPLDTRGRRGERPSFEGSELLR